jgi:hypothetical protein
MGADRDQDGSYPPHDTDDTAIVEGGTPTDYTFGVKFHDGGGNVDNDNIEIAHLTFKDQCTHTPITNANESCGAFHTDNHLTPYTSDHVYIHDIHLDGVNKGHPAGSGAIWLYELWGWESTYHVIENILATEVAGYAMRGSGGSTNDYIMVRNVTANWYGCGSVGEVNECYNLGGQGSGDWAMGVKIWGLYTYIEFLNFVWDSDQDEWNGDSDGSGYAFALDTCVQNVWVRNNSLTDFRFTLQVQGGATSGCVSRMADELWYDSNQVYLENLGQHMAGSMNNWGFNDTTYYTQDVYYVNNAFVDLSVTKNLLNCFLVQHDSPSGGADPGASTITYANNTCISDDWSDALGAFGVNVETGDQDHAYVVKNNVFSGGSGTGKVFVIADTIASFDSDYNIFEDDSSTNEFNWQGSTYSTLAAFAAASGTDANSIDDCTVSYVSASDYHLSGEDTCAADASAATGDGLNSTFTNDIDLESRPANTLWDIGADEYGADHSPPDPEPGSTEGFAEGVSLSGVRKD